MRRLALILFVAVPLFAANDPMVERWHQRMVDSANALKAGQYDKALALSNKNIREMTDSLGPGDAATRFFGIAVTHKALAHAGLGQNDDALWYWQTVMALYPKFAEADVSMFGAPGQFLAAHTQQPARPGKIEGDVKAPKVRKRVEPKYPEGALAFAVAGTMIVEVVITEEGRVVSPAIQKALPSPTLSYAALEAVRRWRFDPATIDGKPVPVVFVLTINYKQ